MLVRDVMNPEPIACQATDAVSDAVKILKKSDISGMPVLEGERLVGVVSESDLLKLLSAEEEGDSGSRALLRSWRFRSGT